MNDAQTVQSAGGGADKVKLALAIVLALGGIVAFYAFETASAWQRWLAVVAGLALGIAVLSWSDLGRRFWAFVLDSRIELRKVVWPQRQETFAMTGIVFAFIAIAGVFFWVLDLFLAWATKLLTGQGG